MSRTRRVVTAIAGCAVLATAGAAPAAQAAKPSFGCAPGFNLGRLTLDQVIALPRTQAAIAAGVVSEAALRAGFPSIDRNGTGAICVQLSNGLQTSNRPNGQFFYNFVDDNSSAGP
jgi:hypothetical protein